MVSQANKTFSPFHAFTLQKEGESMSSSNDSINNQITYVIDPEDALEMARLVHQDRLMQILETIIVLMILC